MLTTIGFLLFKGIGEGIGFGAALFMAAYGVMSIQLREFELGELSPSSQGKEAHYLIHFRGIWAVITGSGLVAFSAFLAVSLMLS